MINKEPDERVDDAAYYSLIEAGESALPCLIAKVTDTRKMRDPRQAPGYEGIETRVASVMRFPHPMKYWRTYGSQNRMSAKR